MELSFNLNDTIKIKLTALGYQVLADNHNEYVGIIPNWKERDELYFKNKVDEDGYYHMQFYDFAHFFGPFLTVGAKQIIEENIIRLTS